MNHWDDYDPYDDSPAFEPDVMCGRCKAEGLHWEKTTTGWVLWEPTGERHHCTAFNETVNDFEVLK